MVILLIGRPALRGCQRHGRHRNGGTEVCCDVRLLRGRAEGN